MDEERFFIVGWGRLTGKFMPRLYSPSVQVFFDRLWRAEGSRYLRDLIANGAYGVLPPGDSYSPELPIKFVRSAELKPSLDIDLDSCPQVSAEYFIPKARARKDDVLLAVKGATIASKKSVAHLQDDIGDAIVNGSIFRMQAKAGVNARFLAIALSTEFAKRQMKLALVANNGVDYLDKPLIHKLVIPTPSGDLQQKLVNRYDRAVSQSQEYARRANALLESIDDYLLFETGIVLPPEPESTIENRIFRTKASEVRGFRFDARAHQYDFNLKSEVYPNARLATVCAVNPRTVFRGLTEADEVGFVPMDAISDRMGIIERYETRILVENVGYTSFQNGDLLWAKITPCMENGKSAVAENLQNGFGYGSTEYHVLRSPDHRLDIGYLHSLLRMKRVRKAAVRFFTGSSGHQRVDADFLKALELPLPPIDLQRALAREARARVAEAIRLEIEANAELERTKSEIEAILLGDAG